MHKKIINIRVENKFLGIVILFLSLFLSSCGSNIEKVDVSNSKSPRELMPLGYRPLTPEEKEYLKDKIVKVDKVVPNDFSRKRKAIELKAKGIHKPLKSELLKMLSVVDNSTTGWLPPVKSQNPLGSCSSFSTAYYCKTYQEAREHNWTDLTTNTAHQFSPKFVYNQINRGIDEGSNPLPAMQLIVDKGCATWESLPYDSDYTSWPSESQWRNALPYRAQYAAEINIHTDAGIRNLKQLLANGEIAVICFNVTESFDNYYGASLPSSPSYGFDNGVIYTNVGAVRGGHAVTIIGYDDTKTYNDGTGTKHGAFKGVNSWGSGWWGNSGFFWMSYEYVRDLTSEDAAFMCDRTAYQPRVLGVFGLNHSKRGQLDITFGHGSPASPDWSRTFFNNQGGDIAVDNSKKVVVDLSDAWNVIPDNVPSSYFLGVEDDAASGTGTVTYVAVEYEGSVTTSTEVPRTTINGGTVYVNLSKTIDKTNRTISLSSPDGGEIWNGTQTITWTTGGSDWTAGDKVNIEFSDDGGNSWRYVGQANYSPGSYSLDTSSSPAGSSSTARVRVSYTALQQISDASNSDFTINNIGNRALTVTSPDGGETWSGTHDVTWTASGFDWRSSDTVKLEYSADSGTTWNNVATGIAALSGTYSWNPGALPEGTLYRIKVTYELNGAVSDMSNGDFTLRPLVITTMSLPAGNLSASYSGAIAAAGGFPPYTFSILPVNYGESLATHTFVGGGTAQNWKADEGCWTYNLPFAFDFYGNTYNSVKVSPNGYLELGNGDGSDWTNTDAELNSNIRIAPLWDDLRTDGTVQSGEDIYITENADYVIIRWCGEVYDGGKVNLEVVLYREGQIKFNYGDGNTGLTPTIGISGGDGTHYTLSSYNNAAALTNVNSALYTGIGLPPGRAINANTGSITGIPTALGTYLFRAKVMDDTSGYYCRELSITVLPAPPPAPAISLPLVPANGPASGGTVVTINGANFVSGCTATFGGTAATGVTFVNSSRIMATTSAHAAGQVNVVVTNPDGQAATATGAFTFNPAPAISLPLVPANGPASGGTVVTINGANFVSGCAVTFSGTAATGVTFVSPGQIMATTPAHAAGQVNVVVTNPDGQAATATGAFT
ncbi:MAG: IPT/TIG domain-containing protein, partial [bacterium]